MNFKKLLANTNFFLKKITSVFKTSFQPLFVYKGYLLYLESDNALRTLNLSARDFLLEFRKIIADPFYENFINQISY